METQIKSIGIMGTGTIGASWVAYYAAKGFKVKMHDIVPSHMQKGLERAKSYVEDLKKNGFVTEEGAKTAISNMITTDDPGEAISDTEFVHESVTESYEIKREVFNFMDARTPEDVVLASSSSGLLMSEIQKVTKHPARCLVAHPFNPPHLIPLVELAPGKETSGEIISKMKSFFEGLGKVPVVLNKEAPGHVANRLALALWREAIDIVLQGVASVEDVDRALYAGPGIRWGFMGQHLIYHLGGGEGGMAHFLDHFIPALEKQWWPSLASWTTLPPEARDILIEGVQAEMKGRSLEEVFKWRDEKLVELLKVVYE
jgi:3-hydroxyacyl-CoA dehydrogenase